MESLTHIDQLLAAQDVKKAEFQIARMLRDGGPLTAAEQAQFILRRARARLMAERPEEALEDLRTARKLDSDLFSHPDVMELFADVNFSRFELAPVGFADRADARTALTWYESITVDHPDYTNIGWVLYQWGRVLLSEDNIDAAIEKFQEALLKPTTVPTLTALCYERLGFVQLVDRRDAAGALAFFSRAANTYPAGAPASWLVRLHLLRSRAFREQHLYTEAMGAAQTALAAVDPAEADYRAVLTDTHLTLGEIMASIPGQEVDAAEHLLLFLQNSRRPQGVDVTWSRVHETLGDLWFRLERYDQAIDAYHNALSYNPYHPWEISLYYQIARSHYHLREYEKTIAAILHMLQIAQTDQQPITDYRVYHLLANAHFALENYAEAAATYQQAIDLAPPNAEHLNKLQTYLKFSRELIGRR
ncbi:MAG TPA: tetratricopeptide repeat protein [Aggregatilineales bacterium]|nr:tetratricopeptide repeat protein [Aggregatilineales bacterium]